MAGSTITQRITLEGADEIKRALADIGKAGEQALRQIQDAGKGADFGKDLTGEFAKVEKAAESFGISLRNLGKSAYEFGKSFPELFGAVSAATTALTGAMVKLAKSASEVTSAVKEGSIRSGTTVKNFQELSFAAKQSGASVGTLQRAFDVLNTGGSKLEKSLGELGIRLKDGGGHARDAGDIFRELADKISQINDPSERAAKAAEVLGRRVGPQLVELLSVGGKGIDELGQKAHDLGIIFTEAELKVGKDFGDALGRLGDTVTGVATRVGLAFGPSFIRAFDALSESIAKLSPSIVKVAEAIDSVFGPAIDKVKEVLGPAGVGIGAFGVAISTLVFGIGVLSKVLGPIGGIIKAGFSPFLVIGKGVVNVILVMTRSAGVLFTAFRLGGAVAAAAIGGISLPMIALAAAIGFLVVALAKVDWEALGQRAVKVWQAVEDWATRTWQSIKTGWESFQQFWSDLWEGIKKVAYAIWDGIVAAAKSTVGGVQAGWQVIVDFFTQLWESIGELARQAWEAITGGASTAASYVSQGWDAFRQFWSSLWQQIVQAVSSTWTYIIESVAGVIEAMRSGWNAIIEFFAQLWETVKQLASDAWEGIKAKTQEVWDYIVDTVGGAFDSIVSFFQPVIDGLKLIWDYAVKAAEALGLVNSEGGGDQPQGFARGGPVWGAGTSTSDSIPAWLSHGEYVHQAKAVRHYGQSFMHAINQMRLPKNLFRGFASGGLVNSLSLLMPPPLHFASGGAVPSTSTPMRPLNLTIGSELFAGLLAPEDVARKLVRVATNQQIRSAGRKPRSFGSGS